MRQRLVGTGMYQLVLGAGKIPALDVCNPSYWWQVRLEGMCCVLGKELCISIAMAVEYSIPS